MLNMTNIKKIMDCVDFKMVLCKDGFGFAAASCTSDEDVSLYVFKRTFSNKYNISMLYNGELREGVISRNAYNIILRAAEAHNREIDRRIDKTKKDMEHVYSNINAIKQTVNEKEIKTLVMFIHEELNIYKTKNDALNYADDIGREEVLDFVNLCSYYEGVRKAL